MASMTAPAGTMEFLAGAGWAGGTVTPLAGDASFRRYFRVTDEGRRAVLMDAPPPHEDPRPFVQVAQWLARHGFRAPQVLAVDFDHGLVLLEDLGDQRVRETLDAEPGREEAIYSDAVDVLVRLQALPAAPLDPYDRTVLQREAALLVEWFAPAVGATVNEARYGAAWDAAFARLEAAEPVTVLRDYHAENLMLLEGGTLGLLDFQDALSGHPAYDLASLLQDARRNVDAGLEQRMLTRYRAATRRELDSAYHVLAAQRNAKIVGIFTRLSKRDGKSRYLELLPRVWRYLERDLRHPALAEVRAWFDQNLPPEVRSTRPV